QGAGGLDSCPNDVGILQPSHPVMNGITVDGLANWSCSIHEAFTSYPTEFQAVARDNPTGLAYIIATPGGGVITDAPQRYAPYVWLGSGEKAYPDSATRFISESRLRWSHADCPDHAVENPDGSDASYDAIDQSRLGVGAGSNAYSHTGNLVQGSFICIHGSRDYLANEFTRPRDGGSDRVTQGAEGMFLDLKNGEHKGNTTLADDPVYYDYLPQHYVVYWFFYAYNNFSFHDFPEKHEGDWEHITVRLDSNNRPLQVAYFRHGCDPTIIDWSDLVNGSQGQIVDTTHPVVYSGLGSHASYPTPGTNGGFATCQPFPDQTDAGTPWQTWQNVQDVHAQQWFGFGGAWGEVGNDLHIPGVPGDLTTGPLGPSSFKGTGAPSGW
ncbi:MAG TPA: Vps62-related protein, partial [Actinomycetota bacterium]|nr:Vps62-related protein [Actinomycetota bacterium]